MKLLILLALVFTTSCTHGYYKDPTTCAEFSYWSTKDIKGLKIEMDGIKVELDGAENQATEFVGKAVDAFMLKEKKAKEVMEALTE